MRGLFNMRTSFSGVILPRISLRYARFLILGKPRAPLRQFSWVNTSSAFSSQDFPKIRKVDVLLSGRRNFSEQSKFRDSIMSPHQSIPDTSSAAPDPNQQIAEDGGHTPETGYKPVDGEDSPADDDYDDTEYKDLATPLLNFMIQRVADLNQGAHTDLMDLSDFKAFWRDKYDMMRLELAQSHESQLFITDPPLKELEIEILNDAGEKECPCCLDFADAQIVVRAEQGITRDNFLRALKDHLYGENVESENLRFSSGHHGMLIPRNWDCMWGEGGVFYQGRYGKMRIWIYCSDKVVPHDQLATAAAKL